jgi:hypothetical protein
MAIWASAAHRAGFSIPADMSRSSPSWSGRAKGTRRVIGLLAASKDTGGEGCDVLEYLPVDSAAAPPSTTGRPTARPDRPCRGFWISEGFISRSALCRPAAVGLRYRRENGGVG